MSNDSSLWPVSPCIVRKVWGGERLKKLKDLTDIKTGNDESPIGESLETSILSDYMCHVGEGRLIDLASEKELPYLVKFIDTSSNLSIQVHPDDDYAGRIENSSGKAECWIILDVDEESGIYLGPKEGVTSEKFKELLSGDEDLSESLQYFKVTPGDFFYVPPGTLHAIGKNVLLVEIQQNSGITYRVWDWNRLGMDGRPRKLHIGKALDVINFDPRCNTPANFRIKKNVFKNYPGKKLIEHQQFGVVPFSLEKGGKEMSYELYREDRVFDRIVSIISLKGKLLLTRGVDQLELKAHHSAIMPFKGDNTLVIRALEDSFFIIVS